jgi:hypothetical protein
VRVTRSLTALADLLGIALVLLAILWFLMFELLAWRVRAVPTFDAVEWASTQCHIFPPAGRNLTAEDWDCFDRHEANALVEVAAPWHRLARWALLPFILGVVVLLPSLADIRKRFAHAPTRPST